MSFVDFFSANKFSNYFKITYSTYFCYQLCGFFSPIVKDMFTFMQCLLTNQKTNIPPFLDKIWFWNRYSFTNLESIFQSHDGKTSISF